MSVLPVGVRVWTSATVVLSAAAAVYGLGEDGEPFGKFVLAAAAAAALTITLFLVGVRDGTVAPVAVGEGEEPAPPPPSPVPPTAPALWPVAGAIAGGVTIVGLVSSTALVWIGLGIGAVVAVEWMVQGWAEHATSDPEENRRRRNRLMYPIEIPLVAAAGIVAAVLGFSRVLLALSESGAVVAAIVVASAVLAVMSLIATRPQVRSTVVAALGVIGAAALIGGGIAGAVVGEREFHHEEEGHGGEGAGSVVIVAEDIAFDLEEIEARAGEPIEVTIDNRDAGIPHNIAFVGLPDAPATEISEGPGEQTITVTPDEAGEFEYLCQVHPTQMRGTLVVAEEPEHA